MQEMITNIKDVLIIVSLSFGVVGTLIGLFWAIVKAARLGERLLNRVEHISDRVDEIVESQGDIRETVIGHGERLARIEAKIQEAA